MSDMLVRPTGADRVRFATRVDENEVFELCRAMHEEAGQAAFCERKVRDAMEEAFLQKGGIIGVIGAPGEIEGGIFLRTSQPWYSSDWILEEYLSFVLPEYRRSTNANDLIEFAKKCARSLGVKLFMGITSTERTEAKVRLYERKLSKACGALFIYDGATA